MVNGKVVFINIPPQGFSTLDEPVNNNVITLANAIALVFKKDVVEKRLKTYQEIYKK